jgi:hypothetical protein
MTGGVIFHNPQIFRFKKLEKSMVIDPLNFDQYVYDRSYI